MDAKRLERIRAAALEKPTGLAGSAVHEVFAHIDQQQDEIERLREDKRRLHVLYDENYARACDYAGEIERLKGAYEVLETVVVELMLADIENVEIKDALEEAQRIKDGKDGYRTGGGPACENVDSLYVPKDGKDGGQQ